jgi:hypothetical protein
MCVYAHVHVCVYVCCVVCVRVRVRCVCAKKSSKQNKFIFVNHQPFVATLILHTYTHQNQHSPIHDGNIGIN